MVDYPDWDQNLNDQGEKKSSCLGPEGGSLEVHQRQRKSGCHGNGTGAIVQTTLRRARNGAMTPGKPKMTEKPEEGKDYYWLLGTIRDNFGGKVSEPEISHWMLDPKREKGKPTMAMTMDTMP